MLSISRKPGEQVFIGEDIVVKYVGQNQKGEAILGISAPKNIRILREELARRLAMQALEENQDNPDQEGKSDDLEPKSKDP